MTDLETFKREIDETDAFIAAIAPEGKALVQAIRDTGCTVGLRQEEAAYGAYFNGLTNTFHGAPGLPLAVRFNMRVHEGIHAIQMKNAPAVTAGLNNFASGAAAGPVLSPQAAMTARRLGETAAHAMQAKFNALAVRETGLREFVTCIGGGQMDSFVNLQLELLDRGLDPEDLRTEVAQRFGDLEVTSLFSIFFPITASWKDELDSLTIASYLETLPLHGDRIEAGRLTDITANDRARLLNAFEPLACDLEILQAYERPQELSEFNTDLLQELAPKIGM